MEHPSPLQLSEDMLSMARDTARRSIIIKAIVFLAAWGAINFLAWLQMDAEGREFLASQPDPSLGIYYMMYAGAVIGGVMLIAATVGLLTRKPSAVLMCGVALILVGVFNLTHDLIASVALGPYGLTIEEPGMLWIIMGIAQIAWGVCELRLFARISSWAVGGVDPLRYNEIKAQLDLITQQDADPAAGVIKTTTMGEGGLFVRRKVQYTGLLGPASALFVLPGVKHCLVVGKDDARDGKYKAGGAVTLKTEEGRRVFKFGPVSLLILKQWADVRVLKKNIESLAKSKTVTVSLLQPHLKGENAELRAAAVSALCSVKDEKVKAVVFEHLHDTEPAVRVAALSASKTLKIEEAQEAAARLIHDADAGVRAAAASFLVDFPNQSLAVELGRAAIEERDRTARKFFKAAAKAATEPM